MSQVLEFQNIVRSYRSGIPVLDGVTFSVAKGEVVGLLGRNGAGKTTLINIALGLLYPEKGSVRVFGMSPTEKPVEIKKRIGYVAETQMLPPSSSVGQMIAFHRYLFKDWDDALARQLLDRFGISEKSRILRLSKGEARQVALLCAVCHRPELLLLDEPASGLDPATRREFLEVSIQLLNREGTSILFSSHYMNDVERLGGRVVVLDGGKVRIDSELDGLREGIYLALIPRRIVSDYKLLEQIPGCLRMRMIADEWHAMYEGSQEQIERQLRSILGSDDFRCVSLPLEELFVELLGGKQEESLV